MGRLLNFVELLSMVSWLGAMFFFSFGVAPTLFRTLASNDAGNAVGAIFPRYYTLGIFCCAVLAAVQLLRGLLWYWGGLIKPALVLFVLLAGLNLYALKGLTPAVHAARAAGTQSAEFTRLHRNSVILNGSEMLLLLAYLGWMATRGY